MPAAASPPPTAPSARTLLKLVDGDPAALIDALAGMRAPDIAEALRDLPDVAGARVMAVIPFSVAVEVFDEPELSHHRCAIVQKMDETAAVKLIDAMSGDQQADLFRELPAPERARLLPRLGGPSRDALHVLLAYPEDTAGGIMTTEFVAMPATWTVAQALAFVREVGRAKETVYAIYLLDPAGGLLQTISLRDLMLAEPGGIVGEIRVRRKPLTVTPLTDREDVRRCDACAKEVEACSAVHGPLDGLDAVHLPFDGARGLGRVQRRLHGAEVAP